MLLVLECSSYTECVRKLRSRNFVRVENFRIVQKILFGEHGTKFWAGRLESNFSVTLEKFYTKTEEIL